MLIHLEFKIICYEKISSLSKGNILKYIFFQTNILYQKIFK